ncbi:hypothetical protein ACWCQK_38355 [Streptomyces sp. NPDC002306]
MVDRNADGASSESIDPGSVNLLTGDYTLLHDRAGGPADSGEGDGGTASGRCRGVDLVGTRTPRVSPALKTAYFQWPRGDADTWADIRPATCRGERGTLIGGGYLVGWIALNQVSFTGTEIDNRVTDDSPSAPLYRPRISSIQTKTGESIAIEYNSAPSAGKTRPG